MKPAVRPVPAFVPAALAASNVGAWERDQRGLVRGCPVTARILGLTDDEASEGITMSRFVKILHPDDRVTLDRRLIDAQNRGGIMVIEYRVVPAPGVERWVLSRGHYDRVEPGQRRSPARGIVIDITDSKMDGHVEDKAFFATAEDEASEEGASSLDRVCDLALELQGAVKALDEELPGLRASVDLALLTLGRHLARQEVGGQGRRR